MHLFRDGKVRIPSSEISAIPILSPNAPNDDVETLMIDPLSGDLYFLTKNQDEPQATIYKLTPPVAVEEGVVYDLEEVGKLDTFGRII